MSKKSDIRIICLLILVFFLILPFFFLNQGLLLIDTGREFYVPQQIINGGTLYKNIYNIYGPFSYQFNAILFSIFGIKFNVLYIAGILNSLIIVIATYLLSREFLEKSLSFFLSIITMFSLVYTTFLYNSNVPYTYAVVYALSSFLLSVFFIIKFLKTEKIQYSYLSCFFAGLSLANKYEFVTMPFILIYVLGFLKPIGIQNIIKAIGCFFFIPVISIASLRLDWETIKSNFDLMQNLINAPSLKIFYKKFGIFFNLKNIIYLTVTKGFYSVFGFLPIINCSLFITFFKKIYEDKPLFIFVLCTIGATLKTFFFLNINHMGIFVFPICLICCVILVNKFLNHKLLIKCALILLILFFGTESFLSLQHKNFNLNGIKTYPKDGRQIKYVCDYINQNTNQTDKIIVLPEGVIINFFTQRKGDDYYYNLNPLFYDDVFKEERILNHFEKNSPEYFVILPLDNIEYGKRFFGIDYAQNFYEMIVNNYELVEEKNNIKIFRKKI